MAQFGIENVSIQPRVYPTQMNDGVKTGILSHRPEITAAYEHIASEMFNARAAGLSGKMTRFKKDPQVIVDGVLALINMKEGTRPLPCPLDAIGQGIDVEFIEPRARIEAKWMAKYTA